LALGLPLTGCGWVPQGKFSALESQARILGEQNKSQMAEIENLKVHARTIEDQLILAERQLAEVSPGSSGGAQLAGGEGGTRAPGRPFANRALPTSPETQAQLANLARRYPQLKFDSGTSICKWDHEFLFASGDTHLTGEVDKQLRDLVRILQQPDAKHLKVLIVGHTDDAGIKGREIRSKYPNNWALSSARAVSVAEKLKDMGISGARLGTAGYAEFQPLAPNDTAESRAQNRRVEIFLVGPETPIVGWTETHAQLYR